MGKIMGGDSTLNRERLKELDNYDLMEVFARTSDFFERRNARNILRDRGFFVPVSFEEEGDIVYRSLEKAFLKGTYTHAEYRKKGGRIMLTPREFWENFEKNLKKI